MHVQKGNRNMILKTNLIYFLTLLFLVSGQVQIAYDSFSNPAKLFFRDGAIIDAHRSQINFTNNGLMGVDQPLSLLTTNDTLDSMWSKLPVSVTADISSYTCLSGSVNISYIFSNNSNLFVDTINESLVFIMTARITYDSSGNSYMKQTISQDFTNDGFVIQDIGSANSILPEFRMAIYEDFTGSNSDLPTMYPSIINMYGNSRTTTTQFNWYEYFDVGNIYFYVHVESSSWCPPISLNSLQLYGLCSDENTCNSNFNCPGCSYDCVADNTCNCPGAYFGNTCQYNSYPSCNLNCSFVGACMNTTSCQCSSDTYGSNCEKKICIHGEVINNECICNPGYAGPRCDIPLCPETIMGNAVFKQSTGGLVKGYCLPGTFTQYIYATCFLGSWINQVGTCQDLYCDISFDNETYWPATPTQNFIEKPCPNNQPGTMTRYCDYAGYWTPIVSNTCGIPTTCPAEIFHKVFYNETQVGQYTISDCPIGYNGTLRRYCGVAGQWVDYVDGHCQKTACQSQALFGVDLPKTNPGINGTVLYIYCVTPLSGIAEVKCNVDGSWSLLNSGCSCI